MSRLRAVSCEPFRAQVSLTEGLKTYDLWLRTYGSQLAAHSSPLLSWHNVYG
jgi:hypothetical protein